MIFHHDLGMTGMRRRSLLRGAGVAFVLTVLSSPARSQLAYPMRPVRLVVPFATGGTTDIVGRIIADKAQQVLGQPMTVDNKTGAGGAIGALDIARAAPDGHVLGVATMSIMAANPAINPKVGYDPTVDFTAVMNVVATPTVLLVSPTFPAKDLKSLVAALKKRPGGFTYATSGVGSIFHLQMELFKTLTGTFITHIPYRGSGPALNDAIAGHVNIIFDGVPSALPFIKDGRLVPLAVGAPKRLDSLPDVPTFAEVGFPALNRMTYYGVVGPKGLPPEVVKQLGAAIRKILHMPDVQQRLRDTGSVPVLSTPEEFRTQIQDELRVYRELVVNNNLKFD